MQLVTVTVTLSAHCTLRPSHPHPHALLNYYTPQTTPYHWLIMATKFLASQILFDSQILALLEELNFEQEEAQAGRMREGGRVHLEGLGDDVWLEQFWYIHFYSSQNNQIFSHCLSQLYPERYKQARRHPRSAGNCQMPTEWSLRGTGNCALHAFAPSRISHSPRRCRIVLRLGEHSLFTHNSSNSVVTVASLENDDNGDVTV